MYTEGYRHIYSEEDRLAGSTRRESKTQYMISAAERATRFNIIFDDGPPGVVSLIWKPTDFV